MAPERDAENQCDPHRENHSSNLEGSGHGGGFHMSPTFLAARESIAIISGSGSDNATTPEGGNTDESSSPERERALRCSNRHLVIRGSTEGKGWGPRHVRQRSWPSWGARNSHTQKRTGDNTSLKKHDHPCYSFRGIRSFQCWST